MDIDSILNKLDIWVSEHGSGCYWGGEFLPPSPQRLIHCPGEPIQQVREEIHGFARILHRLERRKCLLEIGLGQYGGTRYLWQMLFDKVITIEINKSLVDRLDYKSRPQDVFIVSDSLKCCDEVKNILKGDSLDALFIDGLHTYEQVSLETMLYYPLVREMGVCGWHDTCQKFGIERFIDDFSKGRIQGIKPCEIVTLDLADTSPRYGKQPDFPTHARIGLSYVVKPLDYGKSHGIMMM